jgi:sterol 14-demethylase
MNEIDASAGLPSWPVADGGEPGVGHFEAFMAHPAHFLLDLYQKYGRFVELDLGGMKNVLMVGPEAQEAVFRAPDDQLSTSAAYQYMVPVFGESVQYGVPVAVERQQVKMQASALRLDRMKGYAQIIAHEVERWVSSWPDEGEKDFYAELRDLILRTSTHCLMGEEFRGRLTDEFGALYHDLEQAVSPTALLEPYGQGEIFERRFFNDTATTEIYTKVIREREQEGKEHPDLLHELMHARYADGRKLRDDEIVGMIVWIMFAGFHTSSGTASWAIVELARHPEFAPEIVAEVDTVYAPGQELSLAGLRELPKLETFVSEVLRLHPPLCAIQRQVLRDFEVEGHTIPVGHTVLVSPYVAHRVPEIFPDPERFDPARPDPESVFAYIPFGGGRRKCVGNAFAFLQVKSVVSALLSRYEFELVDPPDSYREVMPSLILRVSDPCRLRYRRRDGVAGG